MIYEEADVTGSRNQDTLNCWLKSTQFCFIGKQKPFDYSNRTDYSIECVYVKALSILNIIQRLWQTNEYAAIVECYW